MGVERWARQSCERWGAADDASFLTRHFTSCRAATSSYGPRTSASHTEGQPSFSHKNILTQTSVTSSSCRSMAHRCVLFWLNGYTR